MRCRHGRCRYKGESLQVLLLTKYFLLPLHVTTMTQTPSMVVPLREGTPRASADSLALKLSRLSLSQLLHNKEGIVVRERLVKGDTVRVEAFQ